MALARMVEQEVGKRHARLGRLGTALLRQRMLLVLIAVFVVCSWLSSAFLTASNLLNVARQVAVMGIISLGQTFVILSGGIDLSVGAALAFIGVVVAGLKTFGALACLVIALGLGFLVGLLNGVIITKGKVQPFIATLGTMTALVGLGLTYSEGHPIIGVPRGLLFLGQGKIGGVPVQAIVFSAAVVVCGIILKYTRLGRYTYAIGDNEEAARLSGINVDYYKMLIYGLSGLLAGLAGVVMAAHLNVGEATIGNGMELDSIAAVVIGGTSLAGGQGSIIGTVIGIGLIGILNNLLNLLNVPGYSQMIVKGAIIIAAVLAQGLRMSPRKGG